jgi:hypothetical protein
MRPRRATVNQRQLLNAARHELGHLYIASVLGQHVYVGLIKRDGSGYADMDIPMNRPIANIRISLAGYITERILGGHKPSYEAMCRDISQCDDVEDIEFALMDGRVKRDIALPAAFAWVTREIEKPEVKAKLRRMAKRMVRTRVVYGRSFN